MGRMNQELTPRAICSQTGLSWNSVGLSLQCSQRGELQKFEVCSCWYCQHYGGWITPLGQTGLLMKISSVSGCQIQRLLKSRRERALENIYQSQHHQ